MIAGIPDDAADRAALMLADRRHRRCAGREVCQHCDESWPCDARRALDALNQAIEQAGAWRDHAALDCAALGRVWRTIHTWSADGTVTRRTVLASARRLVIDAIEADDAA